MQLVIWCDETGACKGPITQMNPIASAVVNAKYTVVVYKKLKNNYLGQSVVGDSHTSWPDGSSAMC